MSRPAVPPGSPAGQLRGRRASAHVGAALAVVALGTLPAAHRGGVASVPVHLAVSGVAAAVLLARHRFPVTVLAAEVALAGMSQATGLLNPGSMIATAIATYTVGVTMPRGRAVAATTAAALAVLGLAWLRGGAVAQPALVVLLAGAIGDAIRTQRAHVASATERAERAERTREALARERVAEERLSIARDLHDVVAHQIAVINLHAGVAASALRARPDDADASLAVIRRASRTVLTEIGDLLSALRDPDAGETGPLGLADLDEVLRTFASHGLDVTVRTEGAPYDLPGTTDITALRVVHEALTNAHKHGTGGRAHLLLEYRPSSLRVTVANPVPTSADRVRVDGDRVEREVTGTSQGLVGMRERVESVRGTLRYGAAGGGRWVLVVDLPAGPAGASSILPGSTV